MCRRVGEATILDLIGRCIVSPGETELAGFRTTIGQLLAERRVHVVLNLAGLQRIDARGLGELVATHRTLAAAGGRLTLVAPRSRVRKLLAVTRLDTVLRICGSERDIGGSPSGVGAASQRLPPIAPNPFRA